MSRRPSVILVVGMHRSGTSAVTRVLNLLGAELPGTLVPGGLGNAHGHWETAEIVELHDRMLWSAGVNVNGLFAIRPEWFAGAEASDFVAAIAEFMGGAPSAEPMTVIKDPRMALFIPLWIRALDRLGLEPRFVLPFRHPLEVAASLQRRQLQHFPDSVWPTARGTLLWLRYVLTAERATRARPRAFVGFDALLGDWRTETGRLARQLRLVWLAGEAEASEIDAFLHRDRKNETVDDPAALHPQIARVFGQLTESVRAPYAGARVFAVAEEMLEQASGLFVDYVQALEAKIASVPSLATEFPDFPPPVPGGAAGGDPASGRSKRGITGLWRSGPR